MRIALITGGQPRFTAEFLQLLNQIKGFDSADLYCTFWNSDWVHNATEGFEKVASILPPKYNLAKLQIIDQPVYELPPHVKEHAPAEYANVNWAYKRRLGMWLSTKLSFDMIEGSYDAVLKIRPDSMLTCDLEIDKLDLINNELIFPNYPRNGTPGWEICDQFVVGTTEGVKFYSSIADKFQDYVPVVAPGWEDDIHTWASEHLLAHHIRSNNKTQTIGDFGCVLAGTPGSVTNGRSPFTDNHFHHQVVQGLV